VFYLGAAIYAFGTIFYAILGSGEVQPWAKPKETEELKRLEDDKGKDEKQAPNDREMQEIA